MAVFLGICTEVLREQILNPPKKKHHNLQGFPEVKSVFFYWQEACDFPHFKGMKLIQGLLFACLCQRKSPKNKLCACVCLCVAALFKHSLHSKTFPTNHSLKSYSLNVDVLPQLSSNPQWIDSTVIQKVHGTVPTVYIDPLVTWPFEPRKKPGLTFHSTGCLIEVLIMVYYNPHITGQYNPVYNPTNQGVLRGSFGICAIYFDLKVIYTLQHL